MARLARTVLGDVDPTGWGVTLVHEHLIVDWGELQGKPKLRFEFEEGVSAITTRLAAARGDGVGGLAECTPIGTGRYADVMVEASRRSGVAIVGATGFFHEGWTPMHPIARALDVDALTDLYVREITEGMGSTTVRAGLIKCATGQDAIPPDEEKLLRATARAHRATDAPIVAHITDSMEAEQLDIFESEGVDPAAVCLSHVGGGEFWKERLVGALRRGANVSVDMITYDFAPDDQRMAVVRAALDAGFASQVMLAHDALVLQSGPEQMFGIGPNDFGYIPRVFVPALIASGVDESTAWAMVRENPQRFLARF
jgi:predicted metal-dependent phosphotriesterase family hydrolase